MRIRRANDRGHADHGWLDSWHTFSFGHYYDPNHMGFGTLRVVNEDRVQGGKGFDTHPHRDMEIMTFVVDGQLEHKDTLGNRAIIRPGEIQKMSAGTGVHHSEYNHSQTELVHFYQIWVIPDRLGLKPSYQQATYSETYGDWIPLAGKAGALIHIQQDMKLLLGRNDRESMWSMPIAAKRRGWLQMIRGNARLGKETLHAGDGVAWEGQHTASLQAQTGAEFLLFDLPL